MIDKLTNAIRRHALQQPISFKNKLIAIFLGLLVCFIWALAFFSVTILQNQFNQILSDQQFSSTQRIAADIDNKLRERVASLSGIAGGLSSDLSRERLDAALVELKALHTLFPAGIAIIGLDGKVIADYPAAPGRRDIDFGDRAYFRSVLATRLPYIDQPIIGRALKRPVLVIAVPVFDGAGKVQAVMTGITDLAAASFLAAVSAPGMNGGSELLLISPRDKVIVAASNPNRVLGRPAAPGVNLMYDRFVAGFEGSGIAIGSDGVSKLIAGKSVPAAGWIVTAALPTAVAFGPVRLMQDYLYVIAGVMTLAAVLIIHAMARLMLAPLEKASKFMQEMTAGKMPFAALPVARHDEIGKLICSFNQLIGERQRWERALEEGEQRFRMLVESAPDAILVQTNGDLSYVNAAAVRLFGARSKAQLLGQGLVSRTHPDFRCVVEERIRATNEAKKGNPLLVKKYLRLDGTAIDVEASSVPFHYENADGSLIFVRDVSERIRVNEIIRASEARYQSLFQHMLAAFAHCRMVYADGEPVDFIYLDVNPAFGKLTGLENVLGKSVVELIPDIRQSNHRLLEIYGRVALGGEVERFETYMHHVGRWFDVSAYCTAKEHFIAVFNDITDKVNSERLQRKQAEEIRTLVENSPDLISRFDRDARCIYVNAAVEGATGLHRDRMLGKTWADIGLADDIAARWMTSIARVFVTQCSDTFDFSLSMTGAERYYQARLAPEFVPEGGVLNVVAVARDISVLKGGEAVLRESEQRIHGITANTPGMVFQCLLQAASGTLLFTYVSEGSKLLLGLTPGEIQVRRGAVAMQLAEQDRAPFQDSLLRSAGSMEVWNWEGRTVPIDGEEKWVNCRATPRLSSDGNVMWEGVMFNISASKRSEQDLRQSRQLLRDLSAHMESVREEERKRIAREVHDELGQALTVLRMDVSLMRLNFGGHSEQLMARIRSMKDGVDRTIGIMRNITSTLRPVALDLGLFAALEWLVEEFNRRVGINCRLINNGCEEVVLDDSRATALFRIVQESLTNVVKHAEASEVEVSITLESPDTVCLEIRDDGKGFEPESTRPAGSFGLIGVRERALMLRGTVEIDSAPGKGTRIEVCIPLAALGDAPVETTDSPERHLGRRR